MKYKVGDKVKVKNLTQLKEEHHFVPDGNVCFAETPPTRWRPMSESMLHHCGQEVVIVKVLEESGCYLINKDDRSHLWEDWMFEEFKTETTFSQNSFIELKIDESVLKSTIEKWGIEFNKRMAVEECAELIDVIIKASRGRATLNDIADEIADVLIMMISMRHIIGEKMVDGHISYKMKRLKVRLEEKDA